VWGSPCSILVEKPKKRHHLEDTDVDGRIILKWISYKEGGFALTGFICSALLNMTLNFQVPQNPESFLT
jgi:hypothetical protein